MRTVCDDECRRANRCYGMLVCANCGRECCSLEIDDRDICTDCAPEVYADEANENEKGDEDDNT